MEPGKSSLLDTVVGLIKPQSGEILIQGKLLDEIDNKKKVFHLHPSRNLFER